MRSLESSRRIARFVGMTTTLKLVDVVELVGLGLRRARHARELLVEAEIILDRDRRQRLRFAVDLHAFLGLDRLVQAVAPTAAGHLAASVLIDDDHFVLLDHVLDVALEQAIRAQKLRDVVDALGPAYRTRPGGRAFACSLASRAMILAAYRCPQRRSSGPAARMHRGHSGSGTRGPARTGRPPARARRS